MPKLAFIRRRRNGVSSSDESGQTMIFVVVGLAVVLLAIVGFAVDYGNIWFRRQHAQSAADAACTAAVMDMLNNVSAGVSNTGGFTTGTDFDCTSSGAPTSSPCQYAVLNGYNGAGLINNTESNSVQVSFPGSLVGNPIPPCPSPIPAGLICVPPSSLTLTPFVTVSVTSRLKATFFGLLTANNTVDVPAKASCGLVLAASPIPLLVLDKSRASSLTTTGGGSISIYGGPTRSIQVNSTDAGSVNFSGNNLQIDLSQGGPNIPPTGSRFGETGVPTTNPSTSNSATCVPPPGGPDICLGTTGSYSKGTRPLPDPFATIPAPAVPTTVDPPTTSLNSGDPGCIAPSGQTCVVYHAGRYTSDISLSGSSTNPVYALFAPGIYYLEGSLDFGPQTCVRPADEVGDGSGGTFFYFAGTKSISVDANSGCNGGSAGNKAPAPPFDARTGISPVYSFGARCANTSPALPGNLSTATGSNPTPWNINGSVLLAPCTGTYGDQLGLGLSRGILMMQNRGRAYSNSNMPNWQGGGAFLLSGSLYFHQCGTSGNDTPGLNCPASAYTTELTFGGNASGTSYVLGDIITDRLKINGSSGVAMDLSPNPQTFVFTASLLQ